MDPDKSEPAWYCVRTQPKRETIAAANICRLENVEVLAPKIRYKKATRRGKVWWSEAMFPGYIFVRFDMQNDGRNVKYAQGIAGFVHFGNNIPSIPKEFIEQLRDSLPGDTQETLIVKPEVLPGDEVEIAYGPLAGQQAHIIEVLPSQDRVKVLMEFLGTVKPIEIDLFSLLLGTPRPEIRL